VAFPTISTVLDNFTGSNGSNIGSGWTVDPFNAGDALPKIQSNAATGPSAGNFGGAYWNASTFGADTEVRVTLKTLGGNGEDCGLLLRLQSPATSGVDGYDVDYLNQTGTDLILLFRIDNSVETQLGANISLNFSAGDGFGAEMIGSTLTAYRLNGGTWSSAGNRTDSTYSSAGSVGFYVNSVTFRVDDFIAGTVSSTVSKSDSDTGSGAESQSLSVTATATDTGSGTQSATLTTTATTTDSGTGADAASIAQSVSDTGSGAEGTPSISASGTGTDTGTGTDSSSLAVSASGTDSGSGTQSASLSATVSTADTGSGSESSSLAAALPATDTGAGTESGSVAVTSAASDSGTGSEGASVVVTIVASDSGTGADNGSVATSGGDQFISVSDSGTGTEGASLVVTILASDTGTGTDTPQLTATLTGVDTGAGADTATGLGLSVNDSGTSVEGVNSSATLTTGDNALATDLASQIAAILSAGDSGQGTDNGATGAGVIVISSGGVIVEARQQIPQGQSAALKPRITGARVYKPKLGSTEQE